MGQRVTIADVARHAGVGRSTVSHVLNGQSETARIGRETQKRILRVASELKYRPNAIARMLATRRTDIYAVVLQGGIHFSAWSGFTSEVMRGIADTMIEEGCDLLLHTKPSSPGEDEAAVLADGRVDGALILRDEDDETLKCLVERSFPCVQFFTHSDKLQVPWIDCDNIRGGVIATEHLIGLGHRRIAMIAGSPKSTSSNDRITGFRSAMRAAKLPVNEEWILGDADPSAPSERVLRLLSAKDGPTAVFVWSDDVAAAIMTRLRAEGVRIPEDLSLVGFDSSHTAESVVPPLTSVHQPVREMAAEAARMLVCIARERPLESRLVMLQPVLHIRSSTAPPRP